MLALCVTLLSDTGKPLIQAITLEHPAPTPGAVPVQTQVFIYPSLPKASIASPALNLTHNK